jgi:hypothetical protein
MKRLKIHSGIVIRDPKVTPKSIDYSEDKAPEMITELDISRLINRRRKIPILPIKNLERT